MAPIARKLIMVTLATSLTLGATTGGAAAAASPTQGTGGSTAASPVPRPTAAAPKPKAAAPKPKATTPEAAVLPTPAAAVHARLSLSFDGIFHLGSRVVTVPGRALRVNGTVRPYVAGQVFVVRAQLGSHAFRSVRVRVKPSTGATYGRFSVRLTTPGAGQVYVSAVSAAPPALPRLSGHVRYASLATDVGFGSTGRFVQLVQSRLALLHFYILQSGVYDTQTGLAVDAYHRLLGRGVSQNLDSGITSALLDGTGAFKVRDPSDGTHVEGNLGNQLLALIDGSHVYRIYPISSGKPSTPTVTGHYHVYLRDPGYLPDGMYYSDFFTGGYAVHGYDPAPDYPASHGCMRVPISDAISIYDWLSLGDTVDVYY